MVEYSSIPSLIRMGRCETAKSIIYRHVHVVTVRQYIILIYNVNILFYNTLYPMLPIYYGIRRIEHMHAYG